MNIIENVLIDNVIIQIRQVHEYIHIETDKNFINIFNNIKILDENNQVIINFPQANNNFKEVSSELEARKIIEIDNRDDDYLSIKLDDGKKFIITLGNVLGILEPIVIVSKKDESPIIIG